MTEAVYLGAIVALSMLMLWHFVLDPLVFSPLASIPGPKTFAMTKCRMALEDWIGRSTRTVLALHERYGEVVRVAPNAVHFNSQSALKTIYGAGSGFERTIFYSRFDVYGKQNLFSVASTKEHSERKRLLASTYAKSNMLRGPVADMVEIQVQAFLDLVTGQPINDIFTTLHYYSLDNITNFIYGPSHGGTQALKGNVEHRAMLDDIFNHAGRRLNWFVTYMPSLTEWMYAQNGFLEKVVRPILPMQRPTIYTAIREHALKSMQDFSRAVSEEKVDESIKHTTIAKLWEKHESNVENGIDDLDIASECADHFLAGIDTTADTLTFLFWALSRPENLKYQEKLAEEVRSVPESDLTDSGYVSLEAADNLPYLQAVIKETLRMYTAIPTSEPRSCPTDTTIDGYAIPAGTTVHCAPYCLHRNAEVFPDPSIFNPERWLNSTPEHLSEMKKWWWAFSSGGRMCIGLHLGMSEMLGLVSAVYREFEGTKIAKGFEGISPGFVARHEMFGDDLAQKTELQTCWIEFVKKEKT